MDGANTDHSDSDSGESWTLLEDTPAYGDDALDYCATVPKHKGDTADNIDKDEDTDGISVITDSEPESMPCDIINETPAPQENRPTDHHLPEFISVNYPDSNKDEHNESVRSTDDLLGDNNVKHKTYVHRRNKRLSAVLNIIVLGSVITAAGVAIGHMWGVRDDCLTHTTPSVNKILSNLYKLQEENAYLRNKLKELTLLNNIKFQQKLPDKTGVKQPRCKKMFEAPLNSENVNKLTKCLDDENNNEKKLLENHTFQPAYEKDYLRDVDKLKNVYMQNRSWLDEAIARRLKNEKQQSAKDRKSLKSALKEENLNNQQKQEKTEEGFNVNIVPKHVESEKKVDDTKSAPGKKITYADSLRSDKDNKTKQTAERDSLERKVIKKDYHKKRSKRTADSPVENSFSEEELKKDDRYMAPRHKQERKKRDRHHLNKKQKRRNKYEQWEIKSDYLNDDEFSVTSQENDFINKDKSSFIPEFERSTYIDQFGESKEVKSTQTFDGFPRKDKSKKEKINKLKEKDASWFEKRALLRTEARKKLERELFGDSSPNSAGWYFKRMEKREQCRTKRDNSTHKKLSKRNMNFKSKR